MRRHSGSLEAILLLYVVAYIPNVLLTRLATSQIDPVLERARGGAEILPSALLVNLVLTYAFIFASGWHRDANAVSVGRWRVPWPTRATALSAVGSSLVLCALPLSYTMSDVSVPFMQMMLRGDILLIAPVVDVLFGRRVRWWSWTALAMVSIALLMVVSYRGGFDLPPLAIAVLVLYSTGYFIRLAVMTRVAKRNDPATARAYFVEEKMISLPMSIVALLALSLTGWAGDPTDFAAGLLSGWRSTLFWQVLGIGLTLTIMTLCATRILLDPHENSYCVPLERSASLLAGLGAAWLLHAGWGLAAPTRTEWLGAGVLIAAIVLLSVAPRRTARNPR
ncbi:MAG: hypothetical protein ABW136_02325 [Steroidobacteraceae bacterium]